VTDENLLNDPLLISQDEMCTECQQRKPGRSYVELPGAPSGHNIRTRNLPDPSVACRVCAVRPRASAS
jgi:hypothetical protein